MSRQRPIPILIFLVAAALFATPSVAQRNPAGDRFQSLEGDAELQKGIALTRKGQFQEAIPHFLSARGRVRQGFPLDFNLALCYVGTRQFDKAFEVLNALRNSGSDTAEVENLLAQSYIGAGKTKEALEAVERFAHLAPKNEKLFLYAADACMDVGDYSLGLKVVELGLKALPDSARLLFERGMFFSQLDQFDVARSDFQRTQELAPGTDIAYIAGAQRALYEGKMQEAARIAREGIDKGNLHFLLLTIYGEAVLGAGAAPGQPEFSDAQAALEKVVTEHPNFAGAQLSLGKVYLAAGHVDYAIARLEAARKLDAGNPAVYSNLAVAYRRTGNLAKANEALETLSRLNRQEVEKIGAAPGDRKAGYTSRAPRPPQQ
jgi:tetratricopeptide (TPR) repeat protein